MNSKNSNLPSGKLVVAEGPLGPARPRGRGAHWCVRPAGFGNQHQNEIISRENDFGFARLEMASVCRRCVGGAFGRTNERVVEFGIRARAVAAALALPCGRTQEPTHIAADFEEPHYADRRCIPV